MVELKRSTEIRGYMEWRNKNQIRDPGVPGVPVVLLPKAKIPIIGDLKAPVGTYLTLGMSHKLYGLIPPNYWH